MGDGGGGGVWKELFYKFSWILGKKIISGHWSHQEKNWWETTKWKAQTSALESTNQSCHLQKEDNQTVSVQFSSVVSNSSWPHGPQHARTTCPSPTPRVYSNSSPLSQWCHYTISTSVVAFSSCLKSFPTSGSFQMSQLFTSGGQSIGVSALTSVLPMNTQDWSPLGWTDCISLQSKGLSRESSPTPQFKSINSSALSFLYSPTLTSIHDHDILLFLFGTSLLFHVQF